MVAETYQMILSYAQISVPPSPFLDLVHLPDDFKLSYAYISVPPSPFIFN